MRRQISLPGFDHNAKLAFGGAAQKGNPKTARTIVTRQAMHVVVRSSQAKGRYSFLGKAKRVEDILLRQAERFGVRLYDVANAGNHLHLVLRASSVRLFKGFLRAITGLLARLVLGVERGSPWKGARFWDARPFTRIVSWGRDYTQLRNYLLLNRTEMLGMKRQPARAMLERIEVFRRSPGLVAIGFDGIERA